MIVKTHILSVSILIGLFIVLNGMSEISSIENADVSIVQFESFENIALQCGSEEVDELLSFNPCDDLLSSCGEDNQIYCGHIEVNDPDGSDYTIICKGYDEEDDEVGED